MSFERSYAGLKARGPEREKDIPANPEREKDIPANPERKNTGNCLSFPAFCKELEFASP